VVGALATAFYMTRQVWLVFFGESRWATAEIASGVETSEHVVDIVAGSHGDGHGHGEPHESPWIMTMPLVILAGLSTIGFVLNLPFENNKLDFLNRWLEPVLRGAPEIKATSFGAAFALSTGALVIAVLGIVVGRAVYRNGLDRSGADPTVERLGGFAGVLENAYYLDVGLARFVSGPVTTAARFLSDGIDRGTIDGAVNGIGRTFQRAGGGLRKVQTGLVRNYALAIVFGAVLVLVFVTTRATL
jgi:NADH-quinone oxidoreductase subunit L